MIYDYNDPFWESVVINHNHPTFEPLVNPSVQTVEEPLETLEYLKSNALGSQVKISRMDTLNHDGKNEDYHH